MDDAFVNYIILVKQSSAKDNYCLRLRHVEPIFSQRGYRSTRYQQYFLAELIWHWWFIVILKMSNGLLWLNW